MIPAVQLPPFERLIHSFLRGFSLHASRVRACKVGIIWSLAAARATYLLELRLSCSPQLELIKKPALAVQKYVVLPFDQL